MQVFLSFKTCYYTLFNIIPYFTKIFALFFGYFADFLYLCTIKHVQLKLNRHATKPLFNYGPHRARPTLFPQHPVADRLAETPRPSCRRSGTRAPHQTEASRVPFSRSKHYLPPIRAALDCPFSAIFDVSDFT